LVLENGFLPIVVSSYPLAEKYGLYQSSSTHIFCTFD
jgi:hypothetical protein